MSYHRSNNGKIITFNRDEHKDRPLAALPEKFSQTLGVLLYPKDILGGSWITLRNDGSVAMLLNGGSQNHIKKTSYAKSRGLILLELINSKDVLKHWRKLNLKNIEPFTIVVIQDIDYQLQWDGEKKHTLQLQQLPIRIWSSATLYDEQVKKRRKANIEEFEATSKELTAHSLLNFHAKTDLDNLENGMIIKRSCGIQTQSITQIRIDEKSSTIQYWCFQRPDKFSTIHSFEHNRWN